MKCNNKSSTLLLYIHVLSFLNFGITIFITTSYKSLASTSYKSLLGS
jgi:hypothetical protein